MKTLKACSYAFLLGCSYLFVLTLFLFCLHRRQTNRNNAKKLGEDVETIPPDYRLTEEKVIYLMCLVLLPFHSSEYVDETEMPFHFETLMFSSPIFIVYKHSGCSF